MKKIILALCLVFGVCFADKTEELEELFDKCHTYDDRNSCFELAGIILKALNIYPDKKSGLSALQYTLSHGCDINDGRCCGALAGMLEGYKEYKKAKENYGKCCRLEGSGMWCCDEYIRLKNQGF